MQRCDTQLLHHWQLLNRLALIAIIGANAGRSSIGNDRHWIVAHMAASSLLSQSKSPHRKSGFRDELSTRLMHRDTRSTVLYLF